MHVQCRGKGKERKEERSASVRTVGQTSAAARTGRDAWVYPEKAQVAGRLRLTEEEQNLQGWKKHIECQHEKMYMYFFLLFFFLSKQLNCTDLNISFLLIKKQAYSDLQKIAWVLLVLTRLPWMQIHPDWMEFSQWKTFFYCDFWLTRWRRSGLFFGKNDGWFFCFSPSATLMQIWEAFLKVKPHFPHGASLSGACLRSIIRPQFPFPFFRRDSPAALGSTQQDAIRTSGVISMHVSISAERQTNADTHFTLATCQWDHV